MFWEVESYICRSVIKRLFSINWEYLKSNAICLGKWKGGHGYLLWMPPVAVIARSLQDLTLLFPKACHFIRDIFF